MSDTLTNALASANRSSSVLQGIANPATLNPLAGISTAQQLIGNMQNLDKSFAEQRAGEAYRRAINPQGEFSPEALRQNLANDPATNYAAGAALANTQNISSNQLEQARAKAEYVNRVSGSLTRLGPNITQEAVLSALDTARTDRILDPASHQRTVAEVMAMGNDPLKLHTWASQREYNAMSIGQQLDRKYGTRAAVGAGGSTEIVTVPPPGPGQPNVSVPHTASPGEQGGFVSVPVPVDADGKPTTPENAVRWNNVQVPRGSIGGMPMPGTAGAQPRMTPAPGGTAAPAPGGAPAPGAYFQPGADGAPPGRVRPPPGSPLLNPSRTASPPPPVPGAATPPAPGSTSAPATPAVPGATTPPPAATPAVPGVTTTPGGTPVIQAPPQGQEQEFKTNQDAFLTAQKQQPELQTRAQNMAHAYEAMAQLKGATGKGAEGINNLRSYLQTAGLLPPGAVTEQKLFEIARKYTEREMIAAAGGGTTDMGRRMAEASNAGTLLSEPANFDLIRNDMGKLLQGAATYKAYDTKAGGSGFLGHSAKVADSTDPRGFVWSLYSPTEQKAMLEEAAKDPIADAKLHKAIGMSRRLQVQPPVSMSPPPQRQSFLVPPAPAPSPVSSLNPLLASRASPEASLKPNALSLAG